MIKHIRNFLRGKSQNDIAMKNELNSIKNNIVYSFSNMKQDIEEQKKWINYLYSNHKELHAHQTLLKDHHQHHEKVHSKDVDNLNKWVLHLKENMKKQEEAMKQLEENVSFAFEKYNKYLVDIYHVVADIKTAKDLEINNVQERLNERLNDQNHIDVPSTNIIDVENTERIFEEETNTNTKIYNESPMKHYANILTRAEKNVIAEMCKTNQKLSYKDLAILTSLSASTIKNHICHIKSKGFPVEEANDRSGIKRYYVPENIKKVLVSNQI